MGREGLWTRPCLFRVASAARVDSVETDMSPESASPYRTALAGMIAMTVAMGIGRFVYTPILPSMMDELGLSASDAGLLASANYLGYLLGAIAAGGGWAESRQRSIMLSSLAGSAILAAAMGLTVELDAFLVIRLVAGVVSAFVMVFQTTFVFAQLASAGRNELQALHFGGVGLGIAVSALITGLLHLAGSGWQANWIWAGVVSAIGFAAVLALSDRRGPRLQKAPPEPALPKDPLFYRVVLAYGLFGFGYIVTATFLVAIVRQGEGGGVFESVVWLVTGLAGFPSVWLWGKVARRIGATPAFAVGCLVEAVGVLASVMLGGIAGPLIGGILLGGTFIAVTAFGLQVGRQLASAAPRRALALMTAAFGIGQILGPIVAGYAADWTGSFLVGSVGAAIALLLSALIVWQAGQRTVVA